jgi:DNA polymerase (family 10)
MTNEDIARQFDMIADLMEIRGDEGFRLRAYRRGAEAIRSAERPIEDVWQDGLLKEIPGIGDAIAEKIQAYLTTGSIPALEELKAEVPESLLQVIQVSDVGPKKAAKFWHELDITDIEQLEQAARRGQLRTLPGMGEKSEAKILAGIEAFKRQQTDRISIDAASSLADAVITELRSLEFVQRAEVAGSLRRARETIGDLDLVVATENVAETSERILNQLGINRVRSSGKTKLSVETEEGIRIQVWFHPVRRFGTAWQYATGSQAHNVRLRELALKQGLSLSEHGFQSKDGEEVECATEDEVYQTLQLPWIPPELREDRGEIQAGLEGTLPKLITLEDITAELHSHSIWSDGTEPIKKMAEAAQSLGYSVLAITDHSQSLGIANGLSIDRLNSQRIEIEEIREDLDPDLLLLHGAEVEILADGRLDYPDEELEKLDIVIASLHTSLRQDRETVTERLLKAIRNPHVDIIAHPTGRILRQREGADLDMEQVFTSAADHQVALEINANPDRLDLGGIHAKRALELGCMLSINTDAHSTQHLNFMKFGIGVSRRAWVPPERVLNTWPAKRIASWLDERR